MYHSGTKSPVRTLKKLVGLSLSLLHRGFGSSKCKTEAKLATARIKLLRNRREAQVRQMRRDIAALIQSGQEDTARIRVEHVIREQKVMAANEIIELFCELIVVRLPIIAKQRECPADLKEGISSLIYAAPRCSDIPELSRIRDIFEKKYGKDFVSAATDLRPNSGVNRMLIEKLSVKQPTGEVKLKIMKEIAKEYQVEWDTTESELELLKPPEEVLDGPCSFVSAASMPLKPTLSQEVADPNARRSHADKGSYGMNFKDTASAAQAAAEAAQKAASAAQAAAILAKESSSRSDPRAGFDASIYGLSKRDRPKRHSIDSAQPFVLSSSTVNESKPPTTISTSRTFKGSSFMDDEDMDTSESDNQKFQRRHSYAIRNARTDIKFDDSDGLDSEGDDEDGIGPPRRLPPVLPPCTNLSEEKEPDREHSGAYKPNQGPRVHPKLPDYEKLAARFEALKSRTS